MFVDPIIIIGNTCNDVISVYFTAHTLEMTHIMIHSSHLVLSLEIDKWLNGLPFKITFYFYQATGMDVRLVCETIVAAY